MNCTPLPAPGLDRHRALLAELEELAARLHVYVPEYEVYAKRLVEQARAMDYSDVAGPLELIVAAGVLYCRQELAYQERKPQDVDLGGEA